MASRSPIRPPRHERARSFLLYAFALSILAHVVIGPLVARWKQPDATKEQLEKVSVTRKIAVVVPTPSPPPTPPPPTPPPTPKPTKRPPPPAPAAPLKIQPPKTHAQTVQGPTEQVAPPAQGNANGAPGGTGNGTGPGGNGTGVASAPPAPPTKPPCANPQVPARTLSVTAPETPDIAKQQGITGNVEVKVDLNEKSQVTNLSIFKSANHLLDRAALDAAKGSKFQTAIENCQPIASSYRFIVEFQAE
jgi:periplasmic protein TonB